VITLTHVDGTRLYQEEHSSLPGYLTYCVSDAQVPPEQLPPVLTVDDAWSNSSLRGYFLILNGQPSDIYIFAAVVAEHGFGVPQHASFAWVQYDGISLSFVVTDQLDLKPDETGENALIATGAAFRFGNYAIPFMQDGLVQPIGNENTGIEAFSFGYPLAYPAGAPPDLPADLPKADGTGVNLPLIGPQRYVLRSLALVGDFSNDANNGFNVGIRYFYSQTGQIRSQFYPVFELTGGYQIEFQVNWDPLAPLDQQRSWMKFTGNAYLITITGAGEGKIEVVQNGTVLPSWLRTVYGKPLWLRPVPDGDHAARLVMQRLPTQKFDETAFYMVPDGDFELLDQGTDTVANPAAQLNLLCGLAGTESIQFRPGTFRTPLTTIRFHPSMPAFAPVFPFTDSTTGIGSSGAFRSAALASSALLENTWTTAWVSVAPSGANPNLRATYYAQPEQAALYDAKPTAVGPNILELFQSPVAEFDNTGLNQSFPLAIYAGLAGAEITPGFPPENIPKFERQILSRLRKEKISEIPSAAPVGPAPPPVNATTPQGLLAFLQGTDWKSVLLATDENGARLEFKNLTDELRDALQSNQLFLVASLAEPLGTFLNEITVAGWPFIIDVGEGGEDDYRNILIFKFGSGAIKDLVTDPNSWTSASTFNEDPSLMSLFLQNYILSSETAAEENYRFKKFANLVANPAWEGILALRVTVGLDKFPDDLKGLLAGIDLDRFAAHHFGIETSYVQAEDGLKQDKSSLFGLISYVDRDYTTRQNFRAVQKQDRISTRVQSMIRAINPGTEFYDFRVLQLEVVFENSELLDFTSRIQLTTTRWFGEEASLQAGYPADPVDQQSIELDGSYEMHDGQRSYSFYTDLDNTYKFLITSNVLNYIQIVKARFETLRSDPQLDGSEYIFSRFSFWGYLNFKEQPAFDLFSFGSEVNADLSERQGLYFANLVITMDFTLLADQTIAHRFFAFDAGNASYDNSQSEVRVNSLCNRFPMKVTSILQSEGRGGPSDLGYLSVRTPKDFKAAKLSSEWYGINFELNLGSMGALAAKAGFSASLLLAWSPSAEGIRAEVQIKLPGTGGGKKLLSLQGVLKLSIQYFEFTNTPIPDLPGVQYQLHFRNAGLSLVGMKLPTAGTMNMVLAGDPLQQLEAGSLSWFVAYYRDQKQALRLV
jgi:hypothetical protein